jgi:quercetin dioxygenase-like cupin family protein
MASQREFKPVSVSEIKRCTRWAMVAWAAAFTGGPALANRPMEGVVKPLDAVRFSQDFDVKCLLSASESGDPERGPSTMILKAPLGCVVPWHSHAAVEQLIVVHGTVLAEVSGHPPTVLGPGGFAMMGTHTPHQFSCRGTQACLMFVTFDRAYDIHWETSDPNSHSQSRR